MKVELLILTSGDDTFCDNANSLRDFLKIDSLISISQKKITYRRSSTDPELVSAEIQIQTDKVKSINERFFLMVLSCENKDHIDEFSELVDHLRDIVGRISPGKCMINTLWDDIGRTYAELSYPVINEIENLMRSLIARFMLITVGMNWSKDAMHPELFSQIEKFEEETPYIDDLHKLDFIQLSDVLFKKKRDISLDELDRLLQKTKFNQEDKEKILKYIPKSNWEKYFSSIIEEKDTILEKKWALLYKLRNKIAHNRSIKKSEHEKIKGLASAIGQIISKATEKLSDININKEDREQIINSYPPNSIATMGYLSEKAVGEYYRRSGYTLRYNHIDMPFDFIASNGEESIGLEVKSASIRNLHLVAANTLIKLGPEWAEFQKANSLTRTRLIFVITDYTPEDPLRRLLESLERNRESLLGSIDIHIGKLDESNNYISLYELNFETKA